MDLIEIQQNINKLENQLVLTLDNPSSVRLQVRQINLIQKQLRAIKKEVNLEVKKINQQASQSMPDSIVSMGLDIFGNRRLAGRVRQATRQAIQTDKIIKREPLLQLKDYIDTIILEADKLKLKAQEYLVNMS